MALPPAARKTFYWPRHGKYKEFDSLTTHPRQDHRKDGKGITIRRVTDERAQPWQQFVEANMHDQKIKTLPSLYADRREVQEFIYLVLAKTTLMEVPSVYITVTVSRCSLSGLTLRTLTNLEECLLFVPEDYMDVYNDTHWIPDKQRLLIADRIYKAIWPLLDSEKKRRKNKTNALEKAKLREAETEAQTEAQVPIKAEKQLKKSDKAASVSFHSSLSVTNPTNYLIQKSRVMARLKKLLCFGSAANDAESVDSLALYKEKL